MSTDGISQIPIDQIHESPFNPRKTFHEARLQELAADIRSQGILSPLLARPRVPALFEGQPDAACGLELVYGHRRLRAAQIAGLQEVPCIVRSMTDEEAKRAQISENLAREDVHPIEEAEGFDALMRDHGVTVDQIMEQTGKSRSYVYGRLKLLQACPEIRAACLAGEIGSETALLIARLRTDKLQQKALGYIKGKYLSLSDGGKESFRRIRDLLAERFTTTLKTALFDPTDATLLPAAGACGDCPKRVGNAPEFVDQLEGEHGQHGSRAVMGIADVCTDPDCFEAKKRAHLKNAAAALQARGKVVIDGAAARQAVSADGEVKGAYIAIKAPGVKDLVAQARRAAQLDSKIVPPQVVTIQDPRSGKTVEAVKQADLVAAGVAKAPKAKPAPKSSEERERAARQARERDEQLAVEKTQANLALLNRVRDAIAHAPRNTFDLQLIAAAALQGVTWGDQPTLASLWGCRSFEVLQKQVGQMDAADLSRMMIDCVLVKGVRVTADSLHNKATPLLDVAAHYGVPLDVAPPAEVLFTPSPAGARAGKVTKAKGKGNVAYRDPATGQTWSGRGLKPAWLVAALDSGKTLADFAADGQGSAGARPVKGSTGAEPEDGQTDDAGSAGEEQTDEPADAGAA